MILNYSASGFYPNPFSLKRIVLTDVPAGRTGGFASSVQKSSIKLGLGQTVLPGESQGAKLLVVRRRRGWRRRRRRLASLRGQAVHFRLVVLQLRGHLQGPAVQRLGGAVGAGVDVFRTLAAGRLVALPVLGAP